jgi:hypothetical protein
LLDALKLGAVDAPVPPDLDGGEAFLPDLSPDCFDVDPVNLGDFLREQEVTNCWN